ncbi:MAG: hypothetical protein B6242_07490 [Anaerolineaceae bacterium 4572_78]|nr:MAG: hypothetical protein B6242_07490 [Anaerolineaceae bacterium 4572_78]
MKLSTLDNIDTLKEEVQNDVSPVSFPQLTIEMGMYMLLIVIALGLRLSYLHAYPLNETESAQALVALEIAKGNPPQATGYSPLMATLNSFIFFIFGDSDTTARFASVLLGVILIALPIALRKQLGIMGALSASVLLTLSASTMYWSRMVSGEIAVAVGVMLLLIGFVKWLDEKLDWGLYVIALGIVLLLISAVPGYTALAVTIVLLPLVFILNPDVRSSMINSQERIRHAAIFGVGALFILATAGIYNLTGLATISDLFTTWLHQFGIQPQIGGGYFAILMLPFYEPVIIFFGLMGIFYTFWRGQALDWVLFISFLTALICDIAMSGRSSGQILLPIIPLALLAGRVIESLWKSLWHHATWERDGLFISAGLMIVVFIYITFASWTKCTPQIEKCDVAWILPFSGVILLVGLAIIFLALEGWKMCLRGFGAILLVTMGCFSIGHSWRLNFAPLKDLPFQPMVTQPTSTLLPILISDLEQISIEKTGEKHQIDVAVVGFETPILHWYLRDFDNIRYSSDFVSVSDYAIVLTGPTGGEPYGGGYVGQDYSLISDWAPSYIDASKDSIRWYLFRTLPRHMPGSDQVVMWLLEHPSIE